MSAEIETPEPPNWLSELERRRELRIKARLGHEAGAGHPCMKCYDKCPGLDLHFWRKICKNCKCSKEDHDVHDDDIYGWAQFELLGSRPNKIKTKIVLPGKKDAVELEWAPKGNTETIDQYLKTLAPESLPVKGSKAAQERKQLLQKQIPIHDLDPTLCHELTESELAQMQEYIIHMKSSAGIGQIIQIGGVDYGTFHAGGDPNARILMRRYPKGVPSIETVQLQSESLSKGLGKMGLGYDPKAGDSYLGTVPTPQIIQHYSENIPHNHPSYAGFDSTKIGYGMPTTYAEAQNLPNMGLNYTSPLGKSKKSSHNEVNQNFNYVEGQIDANRGPSNANTLEKATQIWGTSNNYQNTNFEPLNKNWVVESGQNRANAGFAASQYAREHLMSPRNTEYSNEINRNVNLPHYVPSKMNNMPVEQGNPAVVGNVRDLKYQPSQPNMDAENSNVRSLKHLNPGQIQVSENELTPNKVRIGAIRDVTYDVPEVKSALHQENPIFDEFQAQVASEKLPTKTQACKKCHKFFAHGEFAIFVVKSGDLYHSDCFKCGGCNMNLADLIYFYDKEMDDIFCARDFAKIRGVPRCNACDELIFVKEYCLAENNTFHLKHFCCFECDQALAGKNYLVEDTQPVCVDCYEKLKANKCMKCLKVIRPDEEGVSLTDKVHFHTYDQCFCCSMCTKPLRGGKLLYKNNKLYCSPDCFRNDQ